MSIKETYQPKDRLNVKVTTAVGDMKFMTHAGAPCGAGAAAIGITDNVYGVGEIAAPITAGTARIKLAGTVAVGDKIASNADGDAVKAVEGNEVNAIAMMAGVSGDVIEVEIYRDYLKPEQTKMYTTVTATAALGAKKFIGYDGKVCGAGKVAIGVTEAAIADTASGKVVTAGVVPMVAGGILAVGDPVAANATGDPVKAVEGDFVNGIAVTAAAEAAAVSIEVAKYFWYTAPAG